MNYLHEHKPEAIIHRDLEPSYVFCSPAPSNWFKYSSMHTKYDGLLLAACIIRPILND